MIMKPPNYQKDAIPTLRGWKHPKRNEILLAKKFTQEDIDSYLNGEPAAVKKKVKPKPKTVSVKSGNKKEMLFAGKPVTAVSVRRKKEIEPIVELDNTTKTELKGYDYTHILIKGSSGLGVEKMSEALTGTVNSYFDDNLKWKLVDFQASKGLVEDGIFGPKSQEKLYG